MDELNKNRWRFKVVKFLFVFIIMPVIICSSIYTIGSIQNISPPNNGVEWIIIYICDICAAVAAGM